MGEERPSWRSRAAGFAAATVAGAIFPGLLRPDRWREKRTVLRHVVIVTGMRWFALEGVDRARRQRAGVEATLRERLGREPTSDEVDAELNVRHGPE